MDAADSPLTGVGEESTVNVSRSNKTIAYIIEEAKSLAAFAIFSLCLYLTAIAIFHQPMLSVPFNQREPSVNASDVAPNREMYISSVFSLILMLTASISFGYLTNLCKLPPLLGMLIIGIILRNAGFVDLFVVKSWGTFLRKSAFVVILLRGGLGLNAEALKKLKGACLWLATVPCTVEAVFVALIAYFLLDLQWIFGLLLGFVLAAVSPAVVVPAMLYITHRNYGVASGVPTLVIAAASIDDVYAITGFSALLSVAFSKGSVLMTVIRAPIEVVAGAGIGVLLGLLLWYIPGVKSPNLHFARLAVLAQLSVMSLFGCESLGFDSAGPIVVLVGAFVAAMKWKKEYDSVDGEVTLHEEKALALAWNFFFQPLLFTLIGFELDFDNVGLKGALLGSTVLVLGCVFRTIAAYFCTYGAGFDTKERIFIALAWLPKATVQAALAPVVLDMAMRQKELPDSYRTAGSIILTVAVLSILITAPIGAFAIYLTAGKLLKKDPPKQLPLTLIQRGIPEGKALD